jgi:hypothetical protein
VSVVSPLILTSVGCESGISALERFAAFWVARRVSCARRFSRIFDAWVF